MRAEWLPEVPLGAGIVAPTSRSASLAPSMFINSLSEAFRLLDSVWQVLSICLRQEDSEEAANQRENTKYGHRQNLARTALGTQRGKQ